MYTLLLRCCIETHSNVIKTRWKKMCCSRDLLYQYITTYDNAASQFLTRPHLVSCRPILIYFLRLDALLHCPATDCSKKNKNEGFLYTQISVYLIWNNTKLRLLHLCCFHSLYLHSITSIFALLFADTDNICTLEKGICLR